MTPKVLSIYKNGVVIYRNGEDGSAEFLIWLVVLGRKCGNRRKIFDLIISSLIFYILTIFFVFGSLLAQFSWEKYRSQCTNLIGILSQTSMIQCGQKLWLQKKFGVDSVSGTGHPSFHGFLGLQTNYYKPVGFKQQKIILSQVVEARSPKSRCYGATLPLKPLGQKILQFSLPGFWWLLTILGVHLPVDASFPFFLPSRVGILSLCPFCLHVALWGH